MLRRHPKKSRKIKETHLFLSADESEKKNSTHFTRYLVESENREKNESKGNEKEKISKFNSFSLMLHFENFFFFGYSDNL